MANNLFGDQSLLFLRQVLDTRHRNQKLIGSNIANANTPGYAPGRLNFKQSLQDAASRRPTSDHSIATTHPGHIPISQPGSSPTVIRQNDINIIGDGNGVDVDQEMVEMAENQIMYEAATQMVSKKIGLLKYITQEVK